jgi:myo-inositol-1(or 4)-monophosphatase
MVADGRLDATLVRANSHDWDLAAAALILANAGGRLVDLEGNDLVYNRPVPRHGRLVAVSNRVAGHLLPSFLENPPS